MNARPRSLPRAIRPAALAVAAIIILASCAPAPGASPATSAASHTSPAAARPTTAGAGGASAKHVALQNGMRRLWEDHISWTRLFIVSFAAGLPDTDPTAGRLLRNQADIGDAIAPYYGVSAGEKLTGLLKEHILVAVDVLKAAKSGDTTAFGVANKKWYDNMDEISGFLSGANPTSWPLASLRPLMRMHLDFTLEEASARLKGDWTADIAAYEKIHAHILELADALTDGIVRQFPDKFK